MAVSKSKRTAYNKLLKQGNEKQNKRNLYNELVGRNRSENKEDEGYLYRQVRPKPITVVDDPYDNVHYSPDELQSYIRNQEMKKYVTGSISPVTQMAERQKAEQKAEQQAREDAIKMLLGGASPVSQQAMMHNLSIKAYDNASSGTQQAMQRNAMLARRDELARQKEAALGELQANYAKTQYAGDTRYAENYDKVSAEYDNLNAYLKMSDRAEKEKVWNYYRLNPDYEGHTASDDAQKALQKKYVTSRSARFGRTEYVEGGVATINGFNDINEVMTEEEQKTYAYLYDTMGEEKANQYFEDIYAGLETRQAKDYAEMLVEMADAAPGLANTVSVATNLIGGVQGTVGEALYDIITGNEINGTGLGFANTLATQEIRERVSKDYTPLGKFFYQTVMSMADSLATMPMGDVGTVLMSMSSASSTASEMAQKGASAKQIVLSSVIAGAIEYATEHSGLERVTGYLTNGIPTDVALSFKNNLVQTLGVIARETGSAALAEGGEEVLSSIGNMIADQLINGNNSDLQKLYQQLLAEGMSEQEASKAVWAEIAKEIGTSFAGGALSGGAMSGAAMSLNIGVNDVLYRLAESMYAPRAEYTPEAKIETPDAAAAQQQITELAERLFPENEQTRRAFEAAYDGGNVSDYAAGFMDVYGAAKKGVAVEAAATTQNASKLARETQQAAYIAGQNEVAAEQKTIKAEEARKVETENKPANAFVSEVGTVKQAVQPNTRENIAARDANLAETAAQSEYSVSTEGKTLDAEGNEVEIKEIESVTKVGGKNVITYKLDNGNTITNEDIQYASQEEALLYESVANMGVNALTANALVKAFNPSAGISADVYTRGIAEAYRYGQYNLSMENSAFAKDLTEYQRRTAYRLGQIFKGKQIAKETAKIRAMKNEVPAGEKKIGSVQVEGVASTDQQKVAIKAMEHLSKLLGTDFYVFSSYVNESGHRVYRDANGIEHFAPNGWFDPRNNSFHIDMNAGNKGQGLMLYTLSHELTHFVKKWSPAKFEVLANLLAQRMGTETVEYRVTMQMQKAASHDRTLEYDEAFEEMVADSMETMLSSGNVMEALEELKKQDRTLWQKIMDFFKDFADNLKKLVAAYKDVSPESVEGNLVADMKDVIGQLEKLFAEGLYEASENYQNATVSFDAETQSAAPMRSERTWTESEYVQMREKTAKKLAKDLGINLETAYKYIDDINSVAALIADDRVRLDYEPNLDAGATVLKANSEYKYTVDMSTLCAKRLLTTGTFDAIQKQLPNKVFTSEDIVALREMMQKRGYEVACGICYVESTRREMGRITQDFIDRYKLAQKTGQPISRINSSGNEVVLKSEGRTFNADPNYTPNLGELNTTDIDLVKRDHREVYDAYLAFMNARGQAKPKLLETRAEYKGEILKHFKAKSAVASRNAAGGLRLQSFSDFEVPHMIDMMQVVMDMSRVGLKSQAYTKVPAFAEVFGDTGVKINLSLIAKDSGLDSNGNLIFDDVEGINHEEAFRIREKFSKNVGTILVGKNDAHIIAAMADPRIDYIIPFHKSSWKESLYDALGLTGYGDYTDTQNEKFIDKNRGKAKNFDPSEYWDFSKSGDENAQIYLQKCKEDGRIPKFPQFQNYEGYWKLLIDFKMYDNNGVGSPQEVVHPTFEMNAAEKILSEYKGGHRNFPIAKDVVEDFVKQHKDSGKEVFYDQGADGIKYSERVTDKKTLDFLNKQETITTYKTMQLVDGKLYPPMAARTNGVYEDYSVLGTWEQATEHPELIKNGKYKLDKGKGQGSIEAAYNPYMHSSNLVLNDQFSGAYTRPNLVTVECEVPVSELTSGYRAQYAKDSVGWHPWHTGTVAGSLRKARGIERQVFLSRWIKPVRIVPDSEVASMYKELLDGTGVAVPDNVVSPSLLKELKKAGVEIRESGRVKFSDRDSEGRTLTEQQQEFFKDSKVRDEKGNLRVVYHGTPSGGFTQFRMTEGSHSSLMAQFGAGFYFDTDKKSAERYMKPVNKTSRGGKAALYESYLNITNPLEITDTSHVVTKEQLAAVISKGNHEWFFTDGMPHALRNWLNKSKSEIQQMPREEIINAWVDMTATRAYNDSDMLSEMVKAFKGDSIIQAMKDVFGKDGIRVNDRYGEMWIAWDANQIKSITNASPTSDPDIRYSLREIIGDSGNNYGMGVYLDSNLLTGLTESERKEMVRLKVTEEFAGESFIAYDKSGKPIDVMIANKSAKFINAKGKKKNVLSELYKKNNNLHIKQEAVVLADELIETATYQGHTPAKHSHGWLDNNGKNDWDEWTVYLQEKNNAVWSAKLFIANTTNGEKLLYDIDSIKKEEGAGKSAPQPLNISYSNSGVMSSGNSNSLNQERDTGGMSKRNLLANALETAAQNDIEKRRLAEYKSKISMLDAEEAKLHDLNEQIKELSFAKGTKDTKKIKDLQFERNMVTNRINTLDKSLLTLEASKPLQDVLQREKKKAYKRAEQKGKEALAKYREKAAETQREIITRYQESKKRGIESRKMTEMRHKIKDVVNELNNLLLKGSKDKHVLIGLQKVVAEALDLVNMDTVNADARVAKYNDLIAKATDPDVIKSLTETRDRILEQGERFSEKMDKLKAAYANIKNSDDPLIANAYDEVIAQRIESVAAIVGSTSLRDMSLEQLSEVYDMYKMVLTVVRNSNKAFKAKKNESISALANRTMEEIHKIGGTKQFALKALQGLKAFSWNNLKPIYALRAIGSDTLTEAFGNVRAGEDTWAVDVTEAKGFFDSISKKYGYKDWDFKKRYSFKSNTGVDFELSLEQILSLYAYSKREQADKHLEKGGFVFDSAIEVTKKSKSGIPMKYTVNTSTAHNLSKEGLSNIIETLTPEQKKFVDIMQGYLSDVMGEKGNEVSLEMYGVKLFNEQNYFPLKSAKQFMFEQNESAGEVKIKNSSFSKETVVNASNPIILSNFMDVWANHVNDMAMYHSFVLPLEDFNRIFNYKTPTSENMNTESVKMFMQNAYGTQSVQYIKDLITDLNGGVRSDPRESTGKKLISKFKKSAVMASWSVVVQQPSAVARALAVIDAKYFDFNPKLIQHKKLWNEVKKYAPVAIIKEMGRFDTDMGRSTVDYIKGDTTFMEKVDDILSKPAAYADELTWCHIWTAVKRETLKTRKDLQFGSEAFLKAVGERFTEVIVKTQVYDSVLARSANMRSKSVFMNMVTSFMAEPTTSINMVEDALRQGKRGDKRYARNAVGAVYASLILNAALSSIVYAMRDDDEDETFLEKYAGSFTTEIIDSFNPLTYLPFIKDAWSIAQGYDVERSDMSLISDVINSFQSIVKVVETDTDGMDEEELKAYYEKVRDAILGGVDSIASMLGIPEKNIRRDIEAAFNTYKTLTNGLEDNKTSFWAEVIESAKNSIPIWGWMKDEAKEDKLYKAIMDGDTAYRKRIESQYEDEQAIDNAIRKALRSNDPRIKQAAQAYYNGDIGEYTRIAKAVIADGFKQDNVVKAIMSEVNALKPDEAESTAKATGLYKAEAFIRAIMSGDQATADLVKRDLISTMVANGKTEDAAIESFESSVRSDCKEQFMEGKLTAAEAIDILTTYCGNDEEYAEKKIGEWEFEADYGFSWSERAEAYKNGEITARELKQILMDVGGKTAEEAELQVQVYDWQKEVPGCDDITASAIKDYNEYCASAGISKAIYYQAWSDYKDTPADYDASGESIPYSKTKKVMPLIDALPISAYQKTALALCWWSEGTVRKYKLW